MTLAGLRPSTLGIVASMRFPIREPFAGGMEAQTFDLAEGLRRRGHDVTLFDADDAPHGFLPSDGARRDVSSLPIDVLADHHAYLGVMTGLIGAEEFDAIHANTVHHLPLAMAPALSCRFSMTLHSPPTPWIEISMDLAAQSCLPVRFVAVSEFVARAWAAPGRSIEVVRNGVDTGAWGPGPGGGGYAVWHGRIVPEKGTAIAIDAARAAGIPLILAGPAHDRGYFDAEVAPRLGGSVQWVGHLDRTDLVGLVGAAEVAVVSPVWDEPYGLAAAEALSCGTPVACFDRGGISEFVDDEVGAVARSSDAVGLTQAIREAAVRPRPRVRQRAVARCSVESMIDGYERFFAGT